MTKQEFEALTGKRVDDLEYTYIDEMYMRCELDKQEFCESYKAIANNPILDYYYNKFCDLEHDLNEKDRMCEMVGKDLIEKSIELGNEELDSCALALMGQKSYLAYKLDKDLPLSFLDKKLLRKLL